MAKRLTNRNKKEAEPNWISIRTEYVTGKESLQEIAEKYGLSQSTIRKRSANESWVEQREQHRHNVGTLTAQKTAEKVSEVESEIIALKAKIRLKIWEEIERRMERETIEMESADLRRMVQNYCDMSNAEPSSENEAIKQVKEHGTLISAIQRAADNEL